MTRPQCAARSDELWLPKLNSAVTLSLAYLGLFHSKWLLLLAGLTFVTFVAMDVAIDAWKARR